MSEGKNNVRNNSVLLGTALDGNKRENPIALNPLLRHLKNLLLLDE